MVRQSHDDGDEDDADVEPRFAKRKKVSRSSVRIMVMIPAIILQVLCAFSIFLSGATLIIAGTILLLNFKEIRGDEMFYLIRWMVLGASSIFWSLVVAICANSMRTMSSYGAAVVACVLATIPCVSPGLILGMPVGIWGFIVLMLPNVRAVFFGFKR